MQHARVLSTTSALTFLTILAACGGGGGSGAGPADVSGTLGFVPDGAALPVIEPNDSVDQPQELESLRAGDVRTLADAVAPGSDPLDGYRLRSRELVRVRASLKRLAGDGRAPELLAYDPVGMQPVAIEAGGTQEFLVRGACDVVVRATDAAAQYTLRLEVRAASELGSAPSVAQLGVGDELALAVDAQSAEFTAREELAFDAAELGTDELRALPSGARLVADADGRVRVPALARVELVRATPGVLRVRARSRAEPGTAAGAIPAAPSPARRAVVVPALALEQAPAGAEWGRPRLASMPGELLVRPRAGAALDLALDARGLRRLDAIPGDVVRVELDGARPASVEELARVEVALAASFAADAAVEYAERNLMRRAYGGGVTPNDTYYGLQWHYPLIHLPEAWSITTGDDAVIVAVIDTGETAHPDLAGRQIAGYDFISSATIAADGDGRDTDPTDVGDGNGVQPSSFHGTHVAGTIAAATNDGDGVAGVTWSGKVMHLRVLGVGGGTDFDIANAIRYAARLSNVSGALPALKANVINMSLGGPGASSTVQSAVTAARAQNVVVLAAAGNENTSTPSYPASYTGVISVAAVDPNANRAPYSNFGATVDLAAPGGDTSADLDQDGYVDGVLSTLMDDAGPTLTPIFAFYQGTSMACPHAAGVAALMLAVDPTLTPAEVETILVDTATDLGAPGRDDLYGHGLVHAERAVQAASGTAPSGTPVLALSPLVLAFGTAQTSTLVTVTNAGGGLLDVTTLTITTGDGGSWLSAVPIAVGTPVTTDTSAVQVLVNRTGLADGNYSGTVQVASNGGTLVVNVTMSVDTTSVPLDVDLFVLAVDANSFESVAQFVANPATTLDYVLAQLPAGDYVIVAGSDDDLDDFICGDGDTYCGLYPTLNEPVAVAVGGTELTGLDFPVTGGTIPAPLQAPERRVFRVVKPAR
ncbi:MAG: S8 family serine peptidase [Planctomycetes bacterium]|nr:S8 family serine peptidase [Planctomycetota bacterium]